MKFAINCSSQAADLLREGRIEVDCFKCPNWPETVAEYQALRPVYVHFDLVTGVGLDDNTVKWDEIEALRRQTGTPYVNHHVHPQIKDFPDLTYDVPDPADVERVVAQVIRDTALLVERFGAENVIAENGPYFPGGTVLQPSAQPETICRVVEETGCGFLMDLAHARVCAHNLGMDAREYLSMLPTARIRELHIAGPRLEDGWLRDRHLSLTDDDWALVEWALEQIRCGAWARPGVVAFEYGGVGPRFEWRSDPAVIAEQAPRLYELVRAAGSSMR